MVQHDQYMKPIVSPKYSIYFELTESCDVNLLRELEPWCSYLTIPAVEVINQYMKEEQGNTDYDLYGKLHTDIPNNLLQDVVVRFNPNKLTQNSFNILMKLSDIIKDSGEEGETFELDIFEIEIDKMIERQTENIK